MEHHVAHVFGIWPNVTFEGMIQASDALDTLVACFENAVFEVLIVIA
jgi:hypothetical protein